jgi:ATP-dependent Clp protease ATP-binding subunit ClpA
MVMPHDTARVVGTFTETFRLAAATAKREMSRLGGELLGDTELLLGVLAQGTDAAAVGMLQALGVDVGALKRDLERQPRHMKTVADAARAGTAQAMRAIERMIEVAREYGHERIGTQHMLSGLLRQPDFASARALASHGVTEDRTRQVMPSSANVEA